MKITNDEIMSLRKYCQKLYPEGRKKLYAYCLETDVRISSELFFSLVEGESYESISRCKYIPITKKPFYNYQRKVLEKMRDFLQEQGVWNYE